MLDVKIKVDVPSDASWHDAGLDSALTCECGHQLYKHQTGSGAWTGFCSAGDCKCEWPVIVLIEKVAAAHGVPVERLREIAAAPRDEDGWPVGNDGHPVGPLTTEESFALQAYDTEAEEEAASARPA